MPTYENWRRLIRSLRTGEHKRLYIKKAARPQTNPHTPRHHTMTEDDFNDLEFDDFDEILLGLAHKQATSDIPAIALIYLEEGDGEESDLFLGNLMCSGRIPYIPLEARAAFIKKIRWVADMLEGALITNYPEPEEKATH